MLDIITFGHLPHCSDSAVAISRAREGAAIYTDSRANLTEALGIRDGSQVGAIDEMLLRQKGATIIIPTSKMAIGE